MTDNLQQLPIALKYLIFALKKCTEYLFLKKSPAKKQNIEELEIVQQKSSYSQNVTQQNQSLTRDFDNEAIVLPSAFTSLRALQM